MFDCDLRNQQLLNVRSKQPVQVLSDQFLQIAMVGNLDTDLNSYEEVAEAIINVLRGVVPAQVCQIVRKKL